MKRFCWIFIAVFLLLQACQPKAVKDESALKEREHNLSEAANYNMQLALGYLKQGNRPRAKKKLLTALEQAPESPAVNAAMAYFLEKTGSIQDAKRYYQKALALAPGSGAQLNNYGTFLCRLGQYDKAEDYFKKAVQDIRYENTAGAFENAGLCALAIPDHAKARRYFIKALEQDFSRKQSLYELVQLDVKQNNLDEALAYLQKYPNLSLRDRTLLSLAADVAHQAGRRALEAEYRARLQPLTDFSDDTGDKYEYDNG